MTISLTKLAGKSVKDVVGCSSTVFGDDVPVFRIFKIVFEDDSEVFVEGEHDCPYLSCDELVLNEELQKLNKEDDGEF